MTKPDAVESYCAGAAMAYKDCADKLDSVITNAPKELDGLLDCLRPLANAMRLKALNVHKEAERFMGERQ